MATSKSQPSKGRLTDQALNKGIARIKSQAGIAGASGNLTRRKKLYLYNKYKPIAEGKSSGVKVSRKMAERYEDAGFKVVGHTVIVPKEPGYEKAEVIKGDPLFKGMIRQVRKLANGEIEHVLLPYRLDRITDFMKEVKLHPEWDKLKYEAEKFRFGFGDGSIDGTNWNGNRWGRLTDIVDYLQGYEQIKNSPSSYRDRKIMSALQLVRTRGYTEIDIRYELQKQDKREKAQEKARGKSKASYAKKKKERGG